MGCIQSTHTVPPPTHSTRAQTEWSPAVYFSLACFPAERVQPIMSAALDLDSCPFIFRSKQTLLTAESFPASFLLSSPGFSHSLSNLSPCPCRFVVLLCCSSSLFLFEHLHLALSTPLPPSLSSPITNLFYLCQSCGLCRTVPALRSLCVAVVSLRTFWRWISSLWSTGVPVSLQLTTTHMDPPQHAVHHVWLFINLRLGSHIPPWNGLCLLQSLVKEKDIKSGQSSAYWFS